MLNFFIGVFASVVAIIFLQLVCIVVSLFIPELLFRIRKETQGWHVIAASGLLIFFVVTLTMLHGAALKSQAKKTTQVGANSGSIDFTTRLTNVPFAANKSAELGLSIYNDGPKGAFTCFLNVLDANSGSPLPRNAYTLDTLKETLTIRENETGACGWSLKIAKPGDYILDTYVLKDGGAPSGHQQLALAMGKPGPEAATPAPSAAAAAPASTPSSSTAIPAPAAAGGNPDLIWIYTAKTDGNDKLVTERMHKAGYKNVVPQGHWETETGEQYIFYREKDKAGLEQIAKDANIPRLQDYHYNGDRVGKRIKSLFVQNNGLRYVMIVH